mmetsp:Transcript_2084/g.6530  ORF Transcript_2084/g.6530 Transcript_2084/m.6530 type:complete len:361 (+) Transcript_2084:637-1719(+)
MSGEPAMAAAAVNAGVVEMAAAHVSAASAEVAERCAMLLANLTNPQHAGQAGVARLVDSPHLPGVLSTFETVASEAALALEAGGEPPACTGFLLGALTHVLSTDRGRNAFVTHATSARLLGQLCALLAPGSPHMPAAARAMRNLAFAAKAGEAGQAALVALLSADGAHIVSRIALPLAPHDTGEKASGSLYEPDERAAFSPPLRAGIEASEHRLASGGSGADHVATPAVREAGIVEGIEHVDNVQDGATRLALIEALLLLSAAPAACEAMRREGIFPVLRESRAMLLLAEDEAHRPVIDANETLVSIFHLSAGGTNMPVEPPQQRGKFVWEEEAEREEERRKAPLAAEPESRAAEEEVDD